MTYIEEVISAALDALSLSLEEGAGITPADIERVRSRPIFIVRAKHTELSPPPREEAWVTEIMISADGDHYLEDGREVIYTCDGRVEPGIFQVNSSRFVEVNVPLHWKRYNPQEPFNPLRWAATPTVEN